MNGRWATVSATVAALAVALTGCGLAVPVPTFAPAAAPSLLDLAALPVRDRDPVGYDREAFGTRWADTDHSGCDQRNDVLARDLDPDTRRPGTHGCIVETGTLTGPYTGQIVQFQRGRGTSRQVHIDHVVPLADAWRSGANLWTADARETFANDLTNLLATAGRVNMAKGDRTADEWTPTTPAGQCRYARTVVTVKTAYSLSVSEPERAALADTLTGCAA
ncbi:MAG: HNH endonuclease family protein [Pseudonocardia sp.]|nr:HNH endonuclease family protein [Pseudonocardia sp.]